jgi:LysM repeat protein
MDFILKHELLWENDSCTIVIHLDPQTTEFSSELNQRNPLESKSFLELIQSYAVKQFPDLKIKAAKIMIGSALVATVSLSSILATEASEAAAPAATQKTTYVNYTVGAEDTLWRISNKLGVTIADIKLANGLSSDMLLLGQVLKIPQATETQYTTYRVVSSDTLYIISTRFHTTVSDIRALNNLASDTLQVGQILKIPSSGTHYTVVSGDTLWTLASRFGTTVDAIKTANKLTADPLMVGQVLKLPKGSTTPSPNPAVSYIAHKVVSGDNPWNLSIKYGIPMAELLSANGFTESTSLHMGQSIKIPVHHISVKTTPGPQYGERLDWWTEAQYVFPINKTAKVTDFTTGRTFHIKRTIGASHADCEPLTASDAAIMKQVWGGEYSWTARAVLIEVEGRRLAGSISSMPHDIEYIPDNHFTGHFDLHFLNSTRHKDGLMDPLHQAQINIAAGYVQK